MITQIKPISVFFSLPQQQLARVNRAFAQGPLMVEALGSDNKTVVDRGTLQVVDNQVDQTTGTVKLKAEFPNADLQLWPGQFVNVRLLVETLRQVVVVPTAAVQRGPNGPFVYVVDEGEAVAVRPVTVSQQDDVTGGRIRRPEDPGAGRHHRVRPHFQRHQGGGEQRRRGAASDRLDRAAAPARARRARRAEAREPSMSVSTPSFAGRSLPRCWAWR